MSVSNQYTICEWQEANFRSVNKFYKRQKHKGSASGNERVFVVYDAPTKKVDNSEDEPSIIAAVRLVPAENYYWLRSLYVDRSRQGAGIGSQLLAHINTHVHSSIHCFPYSHLEAFYSQCGYQMINLDPGPLALQQLYKKYNQKGDGVLFMSRIPE